MVGAMVRRARALAAEVAAAGHEIAVHGDEHRSEALGGRWVVVDDIARCADAVVSATGRVPTYFRPPYGTLTTPGPVAARRENLRPVLWTTWGRDWRAGATPPTVTADLALHLRPGATVLLHDSDCTSAPGAWRSALCAHLALAELFEARAVTLGPVADHGLSRGDRAAGR